MRSWAFSPTRERETRKKEAASGKARGERVHRERKEGRKEGRKTERGKIWGRR